MNNAEKATLEYEIRKAIDSLNTALTYAPRDRAIRGRIARAERLAREALQQTEKLIPEGDYEYRNN